MDLSRLSVTGIAEERHYSGVYPLLHRGTTYVHFRVHFSRYPQGNALNPARVDMRTIKGELL